ncbi:MAG: TonB-dependent receptor [Candidatus Coatesbacteria bacterium]|nr:TonB-dependent receptor [Candidatus Coatesbacteria bacterium]
MKVLGSVAALIVLLVCGSAGLADASCTDNQGRFVNRPYETHGQIVAQQQEATPSTASPAARPGGQDGDKAETEKKDSKYALEREVVVTATRTETDSSNVSAFVTVVRPEDLPAPPKTAGDMLRAVPGLKLDRYGGGVGLSLPSIRGSLANQVLVMIDGVRLNSARGDGVDLSDIPADIVDRIEIVRGGSSALYGSDAMGGVINIITKKAVKTPLTTLSLTGGSFGTFGGTVFRSESLESFYYGVSGFHNESDGDFPYKFRGEQTKRIENGGYSAEGLFLRAGWRLDPETEIGLKQIYNAANKHLPGRMEFPTPEADQENQWSLTTLSLERDNLFLDGLSSSLTIDHRADDMVYYDPVFVGDEPSGYSGHRSGAEALFSYSAGVRQFFTFSASLSDEKQSSVSSGIHTRTTSSAFLQDLITLFDDRVLLTPAARFDRSSDMGDSFNPKIGVRLRAAPFLSLKANVSTSFRVPGFDDLYWPRSGFAVGNPDLAPEKCRSYDVGVELNVEKVLELEVDGFFNRAKNLIQWQPGRGGVWSPTNVGEAEINGVEARLAAAPFAFSHFELLHTYTDAKDMTDPDNPTQLIRRPRNRTTATLAVGPEWLSGSVQVTRTSESYTTVANTQWLPAYTLVDCGLRARPLKNLSLAFSVENVFNRSYQIVPDYAMPGRSYSLTIETGFEGR